MTQTFTNIEPTDIVGESLDPLKNRDQAAKTNFMGTSLPEVTPDDVGMPCIIIKTENDVDYKQLWRLVGYEDNQPKWKLERDLTRGIVYTGTSEDASISSYQPLNTLLTSLSEQVAGSGQSNANKIPYIANTNEISLTDITAIARQFLAAVNAASARSILGLGSVATKNAISGSDIGQNTVALSNLATGTYNHVITFAANGQPTTAPMPAGVPVGSVIMYPSTVLPDNSWIFLYGQQLQKSQYPELWAFASASNNIVADLNDWQNNRPGSFYQESSTVFRVPNLRNYFIRAWDGPTGPTRVVGNKQNDAIRNITGTGIWDSQGHPNAGTYTGALYGTTVAQTYTKTSNGKTHDGNGAVGIDASRVVPTANENRPVNIVLPFIMKAKSQAT